MVDHESKAIQYVADQFLRFGVIVERAGIELVLRYYDEYWEHEFDGDEVGIEVLYFTQDDVVKHINDTTDIPATVIQTVMDKRQEYIDSLYVGGNRT